MIFEVYGPYTMCHRFKELNVTLYDEEHKAFFTHVSRRKLADAHCCPSTQHNRNKSAVRHCNHPAVYTISMQIRIKSQQTYTHTLLSHTYPPVPEGTCSHTPSYSHTHSYTGRNRDWLSYLPSYPIY